MCGLGAFVETVKFMKRNNVIEHIWQYGEKLIIMMNTAKKYGVEKNFIVDGIECSPYYLTFDKGDGKISFGLRTLFFSGDDKKWRPYSLDSIIIFTWRKRIRAN